MPKNSEVLFPYRQVIALLRSAHTRYITHSNFQVFLKNQKLEVIDDIPKEPLTTVTLTELMSKLYCSVIGVRTL